MGFDVRTGLLDLLLPKRCLACGAGEELLCTACRAGLLYLAGTLCARCGAPTAWPVERCVECAGRRLAFTSARAAVAYEGAARAVVAAWKERGLRLVAGLAAELVVGHVPPPAVDALTFVPGDEDRTRWRGVNTAESLARALTVYWDLPATPLLSRTRAVPRQRGLSRSARRANVRDAFGASSAPSRIALVDDVYTTGATAAAAAAALKRGGARVVHVVTFARAVRG